MSTLLKITFILLLMGSTKVLPRVIYVKAGSTNPVAPYLTRETAADSIKKATAVTERFDTVFVLSGTYREQIELLKSNISIIGENKTTCVILYNTLAATGSLYYINLFDSCSFKNFTINAYKPFDRLNAAIFGGTNRASSIPTKKISIENINITGNSSEYVFSILEGSVKNCDIEATRIFYKPYAPSAVQIYPGEVVFENIFVHNVEQIIYFLDSRNRIAIFKNCTFRSKYDLEPLAYYWSNYISAEFYNCSLVWGVPGDQEANGPMVTKIYSSISLKFTNCTLSGKINTLFEFYGGTLHAKNCIFYGPADVVKVFDGGDLSFKYNLFCNSNIAPQLDSTNFNGYDAPPYYVYGQRTQQIEQRLDRYSDAIERGDPAIFDVDGSRSDIGASGGPGGRNYKYPDLAPASPDTIWYHQQGVNLVLKWRPVKVPDFKRYLVYINGPTSSGTLCSSRDFVGYVTDTVITVPVANYPNNIPPQTFVNVEDTAGNVGVCRVLLKSKPIFLSSIEEPKGSLVNEGIVAIFPNPTSGMLNIRYSINSVAKVSLSVFSTSGEETVEVLCNEEKLSGTYTQLVELKAASGIYIVRLVVVNEKGEKKEYTQKVSLVK